MMQFSTVIVILFIMSLYANAGEKECFSSDSSAIQHKVLLIDAGSSGIRALEYCLEKQINSVVFDLKHQSPIVEGDKLTLGNPLPKTIKSLINPLTLKRESETADGHFFMGATAGLRSLSGSTSTKILKEKANEIKGLFVDAKYNQNVRLLTGLEEGSYAWFGINYILQGRTDERDLVERIERMSKYQHEQFGIIEMGGGSVQVAFRIPIDFRHKGLRRDSDYSSHRIEEANVKRFYLSQGYKLDVYTNSLPRKGLNSIYEDIINEYITTPSNNPCLVRETPDDEGSYIAYAYGSFDRCKQAVETVFQPVTSTFNGEKMFDKKYSSVLPGKFFLAGYFFDRTAAMGLPDAFTPVMLENAARRVCNMSYSALSFHHLWGTIFSSSPKTALQFTKLKHAPPELLYLLGGQPRTGDIEKYCTHLTYMSVLLDKIGLSPNHLLYTQKSLVYKNKGYGVSWPLGYAILSANGWD